MAKLIMWNLSTLDGMMEGAGHDLSWHEDVWGEELERLSMEQGRSAGALLFGRLTYELMAGYWPGETGDIADFMNRIPKFVFSRSLTRADWNNTTLFHDDAPEQVARLKRDIGKDIFVFGSADFSASLIAHDLFDEFRIGLSPHVLGGGTPLFKPSSRRLKLTLVDAKPLSTGIVILRYVPA
ncbi:dihydrofolate reductase family protein [Xanthobacteraceae bacterium Astr-EGSB]|uniref:dihydrofolate reductase family protein n=1 Tax=Astrobacterium formosum TaxID=3069710 RepID=UPI0027B5178F|nr:dihydrofolate reductase family protein [Xanthobacteraceae bacterium Astr-EGSB]